MDTDLGFLLRVDMVHSINSFYLLSIPHTVPAMSRVNKTGRVHTRESSPVEVVEREETSNIEVVARKERFIERIVAHKMRLFLHMMFRNHLFTILEC